MKELFELLEKESYLQVKWSGQYLVVEHLREKFTVIPMADRYQLWLWGNMNREVESPAAVLAYFREVWE